MNGSTDNKIAQEMQTPEFAAALDTAERMTAAVETWSFACYPADFGDEFDAFIIDVPSTGGQDAAARRAYFTCMARLSADGIEPEQFTVCCWINDKPGALVNSGGVT